MKPSGQEDKEYIYRPIPRRLRPGEHPLGHYMYMLARQTRPRLPLHVHMAPTATPVSAPLLLHRPSPVVSLTNPNPSLLCLSSQHRNLFVPRPTHTGSPQLLVPRHLIQPPLPLSHYITLRALPPYIHVGVPPTPLTPSLPPRACPPYLHWSHHPTRRYPVFTPVYTRDFKCSVACFPPPSSITPKPVKLFNPQQQIYQSHRDFPPPPTHLVHRQRLYCQKPPVIEQYTCNNSIQEPPNKTSVSRQQPDPCPSTKQAINPAQPATSSVPDIQYTQEEIKKILAQYNNSHLPLGMPLSTEKPPYSLSALIGMAIKSSRNDMVTTTDIYSFITSKFPYYKKADKNWKTHVKRVLSEDECFQKAPFAPREDKVARRTYWMISPFSTKNFMRGSFKNMKKTLTKRRRDSRSLPSMSVPSIMLMYPQEFSIETVPNTDTDIKELFLPPPKRPKLAIVKIYPVTQ